MKKAHELCSIAAALVSGDRATTHGDKVENHRNIAALWSAYKGVEFSPRDVALMMALLKIARTKTGKHNPDDYVDGIGYVAIAGEIAEGEAPPPVANDPVKPLAAKLPRY